MSNMNEEKEKAWKDSKLNKFDIKLTEETALTPKVEQQMKLLHGIGFDAGVKAERERVIDIFLNSECTAVCRDDWDRLIPDEQERGEG